MDLENIEGIDEALEEIQYLLSDLIRNIKDIKELVSEQRLSSQEFISRISSLIQDYSELIQREDRLVEALLLIIHLYEQSVPVEERDEFKERLLDLKKLIKTSVKKARNDTDAVLKFEKKI